MLIMMIIALASRGCVFIFRVMLCYLGTRCKCVVLPLFMLRGKFAVLDVDEGNNGRSGGDVLLQPSFILKISFFPSVLNTHHGTLKLPTP